MFFGVQCFAQVHFSVQRGYYAHSFQLTLSSTLPNANIIFTTNNSKPSIQNNPTYYNEPIFIANTKTVKAVAFNETDTSQVVSHSYLFLKDIIEANYMDTSITQSVLYQPLIEQSFFSIPVISISSDLIEIGEKFEPDVEASVEMFDANNETAFQVNCGIETWGGSKFNLKKHYRLEFKTQYGVDELVYPLFDDVEYPIKPVSSFNRLLLRSGSQDGLNCEFGNEEKALFIRNRVMMDLQMQMGYPAPHGRFVHVLINQQYEGIYHLMERPDEDFFKDYYFNETPKKEIEVRKNKDFWQSTFYPTIYSQLEEISHTNLSEPDNFNKLAAYLDMEQTAAYLLLSDYGGNFDWDIDRNNLGAATKTHPYKFILWDVDLTLNNEGVFEETYGDQLSFNSIEFTGPIPENLIKNTNFAMQLADAMQCHCFDEGALHPKQVAATFEQRASQIEKALIAESARWGNVDFEFNGSIGHRQKNNWAVYDEWITAKDSTLTHFIAKRTDTLIAQYKAAGIFPDLQAVELFPKKSFIEEDKIELQNLNATGEIYYTLDGTDPKNFDNTLAETALLYEAPFTLLQASTLKARVYAAGVWSAMCPKKYYLQQSYNNLIINEIHFQPLDSITPNEDTLVGKQFEFIELYNKGIDTIDLTDVSFSDAIQYQFKTNASIAPEQFLVLASDSLRFVERYGLSPFGAYQGNLSNQGETILLKNPLNQTIAALTYALDFPWQSVFNQLGNSLSLKQVDLDPLEPANWLYSKELGGTPEKMNFKDTSANHTENNNTNFVEFEVDPFSNQLTIISKTPSTKAVLFYNIQSQLVYQLIIKNNEPIKRISFDFLPSGVYTFLIQDTNYQAVGKMVR